MKKKGQTLGLAIIISVTIFIVGMLTVNFLKPEVTRTLSDLSCSDTDNISDGTKVTCLAVDIVIPYFIVLVFSVAGGIITARFLT